MQPPRTASGSASGLTPDASLAATASDSLHLRRALLRLLIAIAILLLLAGLPAHGMMS